MAGQRQARAELELGEHADAEASVNKRALRTLAVASIATRRVGLGGVGTWEASLKGGGDLWRVERRSSVWWALTGAWVRPHIINQWASP